MAAANAGAPWSIRSIPLLETLLEAPVRAIAEGDSFVARAGCDKPLATCGAKFVNSAAFRGFPNIPG